MIAAEYVRSQVPIAGVPWPVYKLLALTAGLIVLLVIGVATVSPGAAVLAAAGTGTAVWLVTGWIAQWVEDPRIKARSPAAPFPTR